MTRVVVPGRPGKAPGRPGLSDPPGRDDDDGTVVAMSDQTSAPGLAPAASPSPSPSPTPSTSLGRGLAVAVAAVGPLAVAGVRLLLPSDTIDDSAGVVAKTLAHPELQTVVLWLDYLALLTLPLAVLLVAGRAVRAAPVLGWIGAVIAWLGFATLPWTAVLDPVPLAARDAGLTPDAAARLLDALSVVGPAGLEGAVFVACHVLGTVLLGLALWRAVPRWAAIAVVVSQPLHFVAAVVLSSHVLDAVAWGLTALGFAVVVAVARPART
jgi:hypothetical protein